MKCYIIDNRLGVAWDLIMFLLPPICHYLKGWARSHSNELYQLGLECYEWKQKSLSLCISYNVRLGIWIFDCWTKLREIFQKRCSPLKVVTVGVNKEMITTMGGLSIKPDMSLDECTLESKDLLILPGGNTWEKILINRSWKSW